MNKKELLKEVSKEAKMKESDVVTAIEAFFNVVKKNLLFGINISIKEFVSFKLVKSPPMRRVNPHTREEIMVPKKYRVKMTLPKSFTDKIKEKSVY